MGADKKEPQFSDEEKRVARALLDAKKADITAARAKDPQDSYALGQAARACFDDPNFPLKLGYPGSREMLNAELPKLGADVVMRAVLYVRLIDDGGLEKPKGGLTDMIVEVPRPHGGTMKEPFRRLSIEDLLRTLEYLRKKNEPPPPVVVPTPPPPVQPPPAPAVAAPPVAPKLVPVAAPSVPAPAPSPTLSPTPKPPASAASAPATAWKRFGMVLAVAAALVGAWRFCSASSTQPPSTPRDAPR